MNSTVIIIITVSIFTLIICSLIYLGMTSRLLAYKLNSDDVTKRWYIDMQYASNIWRWYFEWSTPIADPKDSHEMISFPSKFAAEDFAKKNNIKLT